MTSLPALPFETARESVLRLWLPAAQVRRMAPDARVPELFVSLHGMLFTNIQLDDFFTPALPFENSSWVGSMALITSSTSTTHCSARAPELFVSLHGMLFTNVQLDDFFTPALPFETARESVLRLWSPAAKARCTAPDACAPELFVSLHGMLFTNIQLDYFFTPALPFETARESVLLLWSSAAQARRAAPDARAPSFSFLSMVCSLQTSNSMTFPPPWHVFLNVSA